MLRERYVVAQDVRKCSISVFAFERRRTKEHLVDQYAQGPPIDGAGVAAAFDYLRGNVLFGADERVCSEIRNTGLGIDCG